MLRIIFFLLLFAQFSFAQGNRVRIINGIREDLAEQYSTIEFGISYPEGERTFRSYLEDPSSGKNPYTTRIFWLQFTCGNKRYIRPAYYMEEGRPDDELNRYVTEPSEYSWRVRFVPEDTGMYQCVLLAGEDPSMSVPQSTGISFRVVTGARHGFLGIRPGKRLLHFSDNTPFFIIGQNIAWADQPVLRGKSLTHPIYEAGFYDIFHYIHDLADHGGNYVRVVLAPWGFGLEWEECGVYKQDRAAALDSVLKIAEERGVFIHLCLDMTTGFAWDNGPDFRHPVRRKYQKPGMTAADLLNDSNAVNALDNYFRYVHARWANSASVAAIEILGEFPRWEGYKGNEAVFSRYFTHVHELLRNELNDPHHLLSTSANAGNPIFRNPAFSFVDYHLYDNDLKANQKRYSAMQKAAKRFKKTWLIGEMGIITGPVNACDPDDWDYCSDISMHNAVWSTAFMGGMGTGLYWWQWKNNSFREQNFPALRWFMDSVAGNLSYYNDADLWTGNRLEVFYQRHDNGNFAMGWVHNTTWWWGNTVKNCKDRAGKTMLLPKDDDKPSDTLDLKGEIFELKGLQPMHRYTVVFYNTRRPGVETMRISLTANLLGRIKVPFPGGADQVFRISPANP